MLRSNTNTANLLTRNHTWPNGPMSQTRLQSSAAVQSCWSAGLTSPTSVHLMSSCSIHSVPRLSRQNTRRVCRPRPHVTEHWHHTWRPHKQTNKQRVFCDDFLSRLHQNDDQITALTIGVDGFYPRSVSNHARECKHDEGNNTEGSVNIVKENRDIYHNSSQCCNGLKTGRQGNNKTTMVVLMSCKQCSVEQAS